MSAGEDTKQPSQPHLSEESGHTRPVTPDVELEVLEAIGGDAMAIGAGGPKPRIRGGDGRIRTGRLAGLSMWAAIWVLAWPIFVESLLNSLVGLVDTTLAAGLSEAATDAIGGASYFVWFLQLFGMALGVGATTMVSRAMGKGRKAVANAAVAQTLLLAVGLGACVAVLMWLLSPAIAVFYRLEDEAAGQMVSYLRICALAVPAMAIVETSIACVRGAGDAIRPLWTMVALNAVNIAASWVLSGVDLAIGVRGASGEIVRRTLVHNPFDFDLGVTGVALGTLTAWSVGAAIMLGVLIRGSTGVRLIARRLRPHWHTIRRLVRLGLPNFLETFGMWWGNYLVILMIGFFERPGWLGAHIVAIRVEAFSFLPGFAMGLAAATLAGQYIGAGNPAMARRAMLACCGLAAAFMAALGVGFLTIPDAMVGVFTQQPTHLELAPTLVWISGLIQIPFALLLVLRSGMRGAGDSRMTMIITNVSTFAVRLPLVYVLSGVDIPLPDALGGGVIENPSPWDGGLIGVWWALCIELVVRAALFLWRFLQGGWARVRV